MSTVSLWQWDLDQPGPDDRSLLSPAEQARADRFIVPHAASRFTAARAAMRRILGERCGMAPASLALCIGPTGKPFLPGGPEFNLSHSGPVALFAVADFPIGVDVEAMRPIEAGLSRMVFAPGELTYLASLSPTAQTAAFFRGWTRKEAIIKAQGGSIADLQSIAVLPQSGLPGWQVTDLPAPPGYAAAIAAAQIGWTVSPQGQARDAR